MDKHYEYLTKLYLRLNGYLVSNLIIHSEIQGNSDSEIDIIGIRAPFHLQEDRQVSIQDELECANNRIEILIADVKNVNKIEKVKFNKGLRKKRESIEKLIKWLGCFPEINEELIDDFQNYLNIHQRTDLNGFANYTKDFEHGKFNFKFTFFCPSLTEWNGQGFKYINGNQMINYIWECLNDKQKIDTCSRRYNYSGWNDLEEYVKYFKKSESKVTKLSFEQHFNGR